MEELKQEEEVVNMRREAVVIEGKRWWTLRRSGRAVREGSFVCGHSDALNWTAARIHVCMFPFGMLLQWCCMHFCDSHTNWFVCQQNSCVLQCCSEPCTALCLSTSLVCD